MFASAGKKIQADGLVVPGPRNPCTPMPLGTKNMFTKPGFKTLVTEHNLIKDQVDACDVSHFIGFAQSLHLQVAEIKALTAELSKAMPGSVHEAQLVSEFVVKRFKFSYDNSQKYGPKKKASDEPVDVLVRSMRGNEAIKPITLFQRLISMNNSLKKDSESKGEAPIGVENTLTYDVVLKWFSLLQRTQTLLLNALVNEALVWALKQEGKITGDSFVPWAGLRYVRAICTTSSGSANVDDDGNVSNLKARYYLVRKKANTKVDDMIDEKLLPAFLKSAYPDKPGLSDYDKLVLDLGPCNVKPNFETKKKEPDFAEYIRRNPEYCHTLPPVVAAGPGDEEIMIPITFLEYNNLGLQGDSLLCTVEFRFPSICRKQNYFVFSKVLVLGVSKISSESNGQLALTAMKNPAQILDSDEARELLQLAGGSTQLCLTGPGPANAIEYTAPEDAEEGELNESELAAVDAAAAAAAVTEKAKESQPAQDEVEQESQQAMEDAAGETDPEQITTETPPMPPAPKKGGDKKKKSAHKRKYDSDEE